MFKDEKIEIPALNIKRIPVKIKGLSPLIFHKWSEKSMKMIIDKQAKKANNKNRQVRNPEEEYENSFYKNSKGEICFPPSWIKNSMINACRNLNVEMTKMKQFVFVNGGLDGMIEVKYANKRMRTDTVRVGMGSADIRYRGEVSDWTADFTIDYDANNLSAEQVLNLINQAGFTSGIGEWRPSAPKRPGEFGRFTLDM